METKKRGREGEREREREMARPGENEGARKMKEAERGRKRQRRALHDLKYVDILTLKSNLGCNQITVKQRAVIGCYNSLGSCGEGSPQDFRTWLQEFTLLSAARAEWSRGRSRVDNPGLYGPCSVVGGGVMLEQHKLLLTVFKTISYIALLISL